MVIQFARSVLVAAATQDSTQWLRQTSPLTASKSDSSILVPWCALRQQLTGFGQTLALDISPTSCPSWERVLCCSIFELVSRALLSSTPAPRTIRARSLPGSQSRQTASIRWIEWSLGAAPWISRAQHSTLTQEILESQSVILRFSKNSTILQATTHLPLRQSW